MHIPKSRPLVAHVETTNHTPGLQKTCVLTMAGAKNVPLHSCFAVLLSYSSMYEAYCPEAGRGG
eukprot:1606688-Pleurochrysis_carterae.AAC.1